MRHDLPNGSFGIFLNLHNFEAGVPNFTNLRLSPTVDGACLTTPLVQTDGGHYRLFSRREMPHQI
jgi:hypothetical protein